MVSMGRRDGRLTQAEQALTNEQRAALGRDRFYTVEEVASILGITEITIRQAIERKTIIAHWAPGKNRKRMVHLRGHRVIEWRDRLAGLSDPPEENFERVE